ncbi:MAG: hypothetical protein DRO36_06460 [Candidatus Hecatellales archaeon]|nr:MAG: hypothetical protein DRO36_06460 [Candidatus Hecatellales archaeon]
MEKNEIAILREISHKLNQLIILLKLSNRNVLNQFKREVQRDRVSARILELADGTLTYSDLLKKICEEMGVAEITVKKKISKLREMGFLITRREGRHAYYENSGLFE